jgi:hypothetical protein
LLAGVFQNGPRRREAAGWHYSSIEASRLDVANLFAVREGERWRVQIVWPVGRVHYFGKFISREDALTWITTHKWLTLPVAAKNHPAPESNE